MTNELIERWGLNWKGHDNAVSERMPDGYWTPWHIANQALTDLTAERDALEARNKELMKRFNLVMQLESGDYGSEAAIMISGIQITLGQSALKGTTNDQ